MIKFENGKWKLYSKDGDKLLGEFDTEQAAIDREKEIKAIEHMKTNGVTAREDGSVSQAINFRFATNSGAVRQESWKGRDFVVVPGYTLPFGIVMNRILYPEDEIRSGFNSLEDTIAPYDHPYDEQGNPVPAKSTDGLVKHHIGAYNRNVRVDGNRVYLEKWIDKAVAGATEHGRAVLNAVAQGKPLETSTGLNFRPIMQAGNSGGKDYDMVATNMAFDHDAILPPGTPGAARPADGVGMLVNCVNCAQFDEDEYIAANVGVFDRMIAAVANALSAQKSVVESTLNTNTTLIEDDGMDETQVKALVETAVNAAVEPLKAANEALKGQVESLQGKLEAVNSAKRAELETAVVASGLLDATNAKALPFEALDALAAKLKGVDASKFSTNSAEPQGLSFDL